MPKDKPNQRERERDDTVGENSNAPVISEIEELLKLEALIDQFSYAKSEFIFTKTPVLFGHIPAVMQAYAEAQAAFEQRCARGLPYVHHIKDKDELAHVTHAYFLKETISGVWEPVDRAIREYFRQKVPQVSASIGRIAIQKIEIDGIDSLGQRFAKRDDLTKPFPDHRWNWHRTFPTALNGENFEATLVVSPDSGWKISFILKHPTRGKKESGVIQTKTSAHSYLGLNAEDALFHELYEWASGSVKGFYEMQEEIRRIHSGEKFGEMNVFITGLKLMAGERVNKENFDDPIAAYALGLDMFKIQSYNSGLNALEYASAAGLSTEELEKVIAKPAEFIFYVMRGIIRLFLHILMEANGEPGILSAKIHPSSSESSGFDPSICAPQEQFGKNLRNAL